MRNLVIGIVTLAVGWWVSVQIFRLTGRPPELFAYLIAVACGVAIAGTIGALVGHFTNLFGDDPRSIGRDVLDALDRISRGDFSVRLTPVDHSPFTEVIDSVNTMVAQLGTVEQARQEFISNVSHEIQSPLTSISGFANLLRSETNEADKSHYLDIITAETTRLSKLSDNLLRLSALEDQVDLARQAYRLDEQLRSVVLTLEPQWSAKNLDVGLEAGEAFISADPDMLRQVWINLIHNAVKYTPAGGEITINLTRAGDRWVCQVRDNGIGLAPADLPHIFERFFRADRSRAGEGNGLGLPLAQRIVALHGGTIEVTSTQGEGTTFTVQLPAD